MQKPLLIIALGSALILSGCSTTKDISLTANTRAMLLPHSIKGYELYSWPAETEWQFTLVTATNRLKSHEEITSGTSTMTKNGWVKITVAGTESIKAVLARLPPGESIFWIDGMRPEQTRETEESFALPAQHIVDDITKHCRQFSIELLIATK